VVLVRIEVFPMGPFQVNSYLLTCKKTHEVVVVDPGDEAEVLVRLLRERDATPTAILSTHGHLDHVSGNRVVQDAFDCPILMHKADLPLLEAFDSQAAAFGLDLPTPPAPGGTLVPGQPFSFGECSLEVLHTPGHSPGSVTLVSGQDAISGDVLFSGSIGRTDLPGGDIRTLLRSIDEVLVPLGDEMRIHPGHGPATDIGRERRSNPFLQPEMRSQFL
jgi:glyoxylase-like metal-dependent hydrolase (beta-lactamase superfamily II)